MILIGVGLLVGASFAGLERRRFIEVAERAPGVVTGAERGRFAPQIEFTTASGRRFPLPGRTHLRLSPGDKVQVLYFLPTREEPALMPSAQPGFGL